MAEWRKMVENHPTKSRRHAVRIKFVTCQVVPNPKRQKGMHRFILQNIQNRIESSDWKPQKTCYGRRRNVSSTGQIWASENTLQLAKRNLRRRSWTIRKSLTQFTLSMGFKLSSLRGKFNSDKSLVCHGLPLFEREMLWECRNKIAIKWERSRKASFYQRSKNTPWD